MTQTSLLDTKPTVTTKTKTVADLPYFLADAKIELIKKNKKTTDGTVGEEYSFNAIIDNGIEYRVPNTVLIDCQKLKRAAPKIVAFKVLREGSGKEDTKYTILPMYEIPN